MDSFTAHGPATGAAARPLPTRGRGPDAIGDKQAGDAEKPSAGE